MIIERELIVNILKKLEENGTPFYPVSRLAKDVNGDCKDPTHGHEPDGISGLTNEMVNHLLHLEDMNCITNVDGNCGWGYVPGSNKSNFEVIILAEEWDFPHCYGATSGQAIIRINANGRQLLSVLLDDDIEDGEKKRALISMETATNLFGRLIGGVLQGAMSV